jgi:Arc/MetJ-type ribon-helix-helix transcriptional regulator
MATGRSSDTQKTTVSLPKPLLERLKERVPARQRSSFIAEALEERLALEDQLEAIEESAACWKDEDHPELKTDEDIDGWLAELRGSWQANPDELRVTQSEEG